MSNNLNYRWDDNQICVLEDDIRVVHMIHSGESEFHAKNFFLNENVNECTHGR